MPQCGILQRGGFAGRCGRAVLSTSGRHRWVPAKKSRQSHHVAADVASFAAVFYPYGSKPPFTRSVAAPFRKRSRLLRLLGCKRPRNASAALPIACGQVRYQQSHQRKEPPYGVVFSLACIIRRDLTERPQNAAVRRRLCKRVNAPKQKSSHRLLSDSVIAPVPFWQGRWCRSSF